MRFRFNLSLREIPDLMAARGIVLSHQTVKNWCDTFGAAYAKEVRRRRPRPGDKWHLDEIVVRINGVHHYLWRAVDQHGMTLGIMASRHRDARAASKFLRKLLKTEQYVPRVLVTDKLRSYGAAQRVVMSSVEHRSHKRLNNRVENSHQRPAHGNRRCVVSRRRVTPNDSARPTTRSMSTSGRRRHRLGADAHRATPERTSRRLERHHRRPSRPELPRPEDGSTNHPRPTVSA